MNKSYIITFSADDRPGLVNEIAAIVNEHNGSWQESRLAQLNGKFAGIIRIAVSDNHFDDLKHDLMPLNSQGYSLSIEAIENKVESDPDIRRFSIITLDRPGIINEVSKVMSSLNVNLVDIKTSITSAAMSGEALFQAEVQFELPVTLGLSEIKTRLDEVADMLDLEIVLD